jgi:hypothetical protein
MTFYTQICSRLSSIHSYVNKKFRSLLHVNTKNNEFKYFLSIIWIILYGFCNYIRFCFRFICYNFYALTQDIGSIIIPYDILTIRENEQGNQILSSVCIPKNDNSTIQNIWTLVNIEYSKTDSKYNFVLENTGNKVIHDQPLKIKVVPELCLIVR